MRVARGIAACLLLSSGVTYAADDAARLLLGRLVSARQASPESATASRATITCVVSSARESHAHGAHVFACVSSAGEILGAVLSPKGQVRCGVSGDLDVASRCGTLVVCGVLNDVCL